MDNVDNSLKLVLVIYDISNNKRRRKACKVLDSYGIRIQESAFECRITVYEVKIMYGKLLKALKVTEDKVRIYQLNETNVIHTIGSYEGPCNKTYEVV